MTRPNVLVLTGYGINCDEETKFAFEQAGAKADIVHINDIIAGMKRLHDYQILAFPGGFSFGDDTGAGNALANRVRNHLKEDVQKFVEADKLVIGICNGFQVTVNLGLLPATDKGYGKREVALTHNDSARYLDRWVDLKFSGNSPWLIKMTEASFPIAHGEGKFFAEQKVLDELNAKGQIALKYVSGEICRYQGFDANPNGSLEEIAGITDPTGRIIGMMPHPERAIQFTQRPDWHLRKQELKRAGKEIPKEGEGMRIFRNGVYYFK